MRRWWNGSSRSSIPEQVILFGSHVWGDPNDDSDIDLMVVLPPDETSPRDWMRHAIQCLRTVDVPNDVIVTTGREV